MVALSVHKPPVSLNSISTQSFFFCTVQTEVDMKESGRLIRNTEKVSYTQKQGPNSLV